jgi:transcriptional regulator with XRE-family HTH domain
MHQTVPDPNSLQKEIGGNIEYFRLLRRKTIKEMASVLNLSISGYRNIERGFTEVGITKIFKIAKTLNIEVSQLLYSNNPTITNAHKSIDNPNSEMVESYIQSHKQEIIFLRKQVEILTMQK